MVQKLLTSRDWHWPCTCLDLEVSAEEIDFRNFADSDLKLGQGGAKIIWDWVTNLQRILPSSFRVGRQNNSPEKWINSIFTHVPPAM